MKRFHAGSMAAVCLGVLALGGCKKEAAKPAEPTAAEAKPADEAKKPEEAKKTLQRTDLGMLKALPANFDSATNPPSDAKIALGQLLYFDKRLSKNQDLACASCHELDKGGADGKPFSPGHKGQLGGRNAPSSLNAAGHLAQFWDGRAKDVEEQAKGPILNPVEMAMPNPEAVLAVLKSIPAYTKAFQDAFPGEADPVTYDNVGKAIGAFERKLVTPSALDKYLNGDDAALTEAEKAGALEFVNVGCAGCHNGALVGGGMYQKAGLIKPWPNQKDEGRFAVTKNEADKFFFKVPSLRNVAKTAPYFHDGSAATLDAAIKTMAEHQLGKTLTDAQVTSIAAFLNALTGQVPANLAAAPQLPPSTDTTPKPIAD